MRTAILALAVLVGCAAALSPRLAAPTFKANAVEDEAFTQLQLQDYRGKWVVLIFYPFGARAGSPCARWAPTARARRHAHAPAEPSCDLGFHPGSRLHVRCESDAALRCRGCIAQHARFVPHVAPQCAPRS